MTISIIHVITTIELGGAEKQLLALASQQRKMGATVEVIFLKDKPSLLSEFSKSDVLVNTQYYELNFLNQIFLLWKRRVEKNSVFHAHLPRAELLCALSLAKNSFLVTRHNSEAFFPGVQSVISKVISRFVLSRSFASISISRAVSEYLTKSGEISQSSRNHVIYYGFPITTVKSQKRRLDNAKEFRIGSVSRLVKQKNLPFLLEVIRILSRVKKTNFQVSIAGEGPLLDELIALSAKLGTSSVVNWLGKVSNIDSFYDSLDLFVLTSDYEGFGLVMLEAMYSGIPIVARRVSAIPEVLGTSHPGLVEEDSAEAFAQKVSLMLINKELREECLRYQEKELSKFSMERVWVQHNQIYLDLLSLQL